MYSGAMMPGAAAADPFFRGASSAARPLSSFLRSLFSIVNDPATDDVVSWSAEGTSFVIHSVERFSEEVLPQYYKHSNFSSFSRQLNFYSFKKVMEEDEDHYNGSAGGSGSHGGAGHGSGAKHSATFEYRHKYFLRGRPDLLIRVVRKTNASAIKELAAEEKADKARRKRQEEGVAPSGHAVASHHHHHGGGIVPPLPGGSAAAGLPVPGALALAGGMRMELLMEGGEGAAGSSGGGFEPLGSIYGHSGGPAAAAAQDPMMAMHGGRGGPGAMHHPYHAPPQQQQQLAYQAAGAGGRASALSHPSDDSGAAGGMQRQSSSGGAASGQDPVTALLVSLGLVEGDSSGSAGSVHSSAPGAAGSAPFKTVSALTTTLTRPVSSTGPLALGPGGVFLPGSSGHMQPYAAAYGGAARYGSAAPPQQRPGAVPPAGTFQPLTAAGAAGQLSRAASTAPGSGPAPPPATPLLLSLDGEDDEEEAGLDSKGRSQDVTSAAAADGSVSSGEQQAFVGEGPAALAAHLAQAAAAAGLLPAAAAEAGASTAAAPAGSAGLQGLLTALTTPTPDGSVDWAAGIPASASAEKREQLAALRQMVVALSGSLTGTQSSLMSLVQGGATLLPMLQANPALAAGAIKDAQTPAGGADADGAHTGSSAPGASSLDVTALGSPVGGAGSLPVPERAGPSPAAAAAAAAAGFMPPAPPSAVMQPALNAALGAAASAAADALSAAVCKPAPASDGEGDSDASSGKLALFPSQQQQQRSRLVDPQLILEAVAAAPQTLELAGLLRTLTADGIRDLSSSKALASIPAAGEGEGDAPGAEAGGEEGKAAAPQSKRVPQLLRQLLQRLVELPSATSSGSEEGSEGGSGPTALRLTDLSPQQLEALQKLVLAAAAAAASQSVLPSAALSAVHRAPTLLQQQQAQHMFAGRPPLPHPAAYGGRGGHLMRPGPHGMMPMQAHGQPGGGPFPVSYAPLGSGGVLDLTPGPPSTAHLYVTSPPFRNNPAAPHLQKGKAQQQPAQGGPAATRGGRHSGRASAAGGEDRERDRSRERERDRSDGDSSEREGGSSYYDGSYRSGRNSGHGHRAGGASFTKGGAAVAGPRYRGNRERGDSDLSAYGGSTGEGSGNSPVSGGHRSSSAVELLHGEGGDGHVAVVGRGGMHRHYREQQGVTVVSRNGQGAAASGAGVSGWIASRRQQRGSAASASSSSSNASSNTLASAFSGISAPPSPGLLSLGLGFQLGLGLGDAEGEEGDTCEGDEEAAGQNDFSQGSGSGTGRGRLASAATSDTYNYFHGLPLPPSTATVGGSDDAASAAGSEGAGNNSLEYGRDGAGAGDEADADGASTTRLGRRSRASRAAETARASVASNPYSRPYGAAADYEGEEGEGDDEGEGDAEDEEAAATVAGQRSRRGGIASRGRVARSGKGKGPLSGPNTRAHRALLPLPPAVGGWSGAGEGAGSGGAGGSMLSPGAAGLGISNGEGGSDSGLLARRQVKRPRKLQVGEGEGGEAEHAGAPQAAGPLLAPAAVNSAVSARGGQHAQAQAAGLAAVGGSLFSPCGGYPMPTPQHAGLAGLPSTTAAASRASSAAAGGLQAPHTSAGGSPPAPESPIFTPHASSGSAGRQTAAYTNVSSRVVGVAGGVPADAGSATRTGTGALTFPASTMARLSGLSLGSPQPVQHTSHGGAGAAAAAARALADATAREDAGAAAAGAEAASRLVHPPLPPLDTANALAGGAAALTTSRAGGGGLGLLTMLHAQYRQAPAAGAAPAGSQGGAMPHPGGVPGVAPAFMAGLPGYLFAPTPAHGGPRGSGLPGMGALPSTRAGGVASSGSSSALSSAASTSAASSASSGSALGASFGGLGLSLMSPAGGGSSSAGGGSGGFQSGYGLLSSMAAGGSGGGVWGSNPLSMFSSTHLMQQQQQRQMQGQVQRPSAGGDASVSRMNAMDVSAFLSSGAFSTRHLAGAGGLPSTTAAGLREAAASSWIASGSGFAPPSPPASASGVSAFRAVAAAAAPAAHVPAPVATQAPAAAPSTTVAAAAAPASSNFTSPLAATLGVQLTVAPAVAAQSAPGAASTAAPGGKMLSPSLFHLSSALSPALFSPGLAHTCLSATAAAAVNRSKARMASVAGGAAPGSASGAAGAVGVEGVTPSGHRAMQSAARRNMRHSHQGAAAGEDDGAESSTSASSSEGTGR